MDSSSRVRRMQRQASQVVVYLADVAREEPLSKVEY